MNKNLDKAIKIVKSGGIIIFPTDTAFGVGCRIDDRESVQKLFKLRRRPSEKAVPILVSSIKMAKKYAQVNSQAENLMKKHWPGGLTIVVPAKKEVLGLVRGGGETVGVRMPNHRSIIELIRKVDCPIVGSSANFAGDKTPYSLKDLDQKLTKLVDFVIKGRCSTKKASTVVSFTGESIKVLRVGAVKI